MKSICVGLALIPLLVFSQSKTEIREITGKMVGIEPSWHFALEIIRMEVNGAEERYLFWPNHGKFIIDHVKPGDPITLKVEIDLVWQQRRKDMAKDPRLRGIMHRFLHDRITEIYLDGKWFPLPYIQAEPRKDPDVKVMLEKPILAVFPNEQNKTAFIFSGGVVGNFAFLADVRPEYRVPGKGDVVSFLAHREVPLLSDQAAYPVAGVKEVYLYSPLIKQTGQIKSFLFKQNSVCIGLTMISNGAEVSVGFPSDFAVQIRDFLKDGRRADFYYMGFRVENQPNPFELHALVSESDTLRIERPMYYGGEDVAHDHRPVEVSGKITRVDRSPHMKIMSIMVGKDAYVDIDAGTAQQLEKLLRKGAVVSVQGDERIRKEGEIYREQHRIIIPRKLVIDGKEFLLK